MRAAGRAALAAVAMLGAACSGSSTHVSGSLGVLPEVPSAHATTAPKAQLARVLEKHFHLRVGSIEISAAVMSDKNAVAAFHTEAHGTRKATFGFGSLEFRRNAWHADDVVPDVGKHRPKGGSRSYPLRSVGAGRWIGVGGFVDPRVTRVEAMGPTGSFVDQEGVKDGAVALFAVKEATVAGYDRDGLLFATPVLVGIPAQLGGGDAAIGIGHAFSTDIISTRWTAAADLLAAGVSAKYLLPPLHLFLSAPDARVAGRGVATKAGATFLVAIGSQRWRLDLFIVPHGGTYKVRQYTLERLRP